MIPLKRRLFKVIDLDGKSAFFLCPNYQGKGRRVVLISGTRWTDAMLKHVGIKSEPFFVREKRTTEPDTYPNGHPWGWAYQVADVLKDEVRWLTQEQYRELDESLERELSKLDEADRQAKELDGERFESPVSK
jgi:hypothetical protein